MAEPKKRGCLGCSLPIVILVAVVAIGIVVIGFLAGPIGQAMFHLDLPSWIVVEKPAIHLAAPHLFEIGGFPITNTMLAGWFTVIFLVVGSWLITRRMKIVPNRIQVIFEFLLGWIYDLCESVAGKENGRKFFPVVCTIFLFVAFNAWLSLIPGFGSILVGGGGHEYELLRGANTDLNTPLAISLVSCVFVAFYGMKSIGFSWVKQYFNFGPLLRSIGGIFKGKINFMDIFSNFVNAFVGGLEFLSMLIRIISFTFRLFGNMTAGEILVVIVAFLVPMAMSWVVYGFELFVGFIQALVFAGLTLVFVTMAVASHEGELHENKNTEEKELLKEGT